VGELEDAIQQLVVAQDLSIEVPPKDLVKLPKDVGKTLSYVLRVQKDAITVLPDILKERLSQDKKLGGLSLLISGTAKVSGELLGAVRGIRDEHVKGLEEVVSTREKIIEVLRENNNLLSQRVKLLTGSDRDE